MDDVGLEKREIGRKLRVGVLVSGFGSNLQALIDLCSTPESAAEIALVISNKAGVGALDRAAKAGIPVEVIPHGQFPDRSAFDAALDRRLRESGVELVCLAGFMRLLTPGFVDGWRNKVINVHPSLLPSFKGLHTHARALEAGVRLHGCTVHFVRAELDDGPIIVQAAIPVLEGDDEDSLAGRVLVQEHRAYPLAVRLIAEGRVQVEGERVVIRGASGDALASLLNPSQS